MRWKLKEVSPTSHLKYRTKAECQHFLLEEKWIGEPKVRIVTRASDGSVVICTAAKVDELWETWAICQHLNPTLDPSGHLDKKAVVDMFRAYVGPMDSPTYKHNPTYHPHSPKQPYSPGYRHLHPHHSADGEHTPPHSVRSFSSDTTYISDDDSPVPRQSSSFMSEFAPLHRFSPPSHHYQHHHASHDPAHREPSLPLDHTPKTSGGSLSLTASVLGFWNGLCTQQDRHSACDGGAHGPDENARKLAHTPCHPTRFDSSPTSPMYNNSPHDEEPVPVISAKNFFAICPCQRQVIAVVYFVLLRLVPWTVFCALVLPGLWVFGLRAHARKNKTA